MGSLPHYGKAPKRLASAYAGTAVYENWRFADPKIAEPDIWYRGIPTHPETVGPNKGKFCMNPQKLDMCNNISQKTFPPAPAPKAETKPLQMPWHALHKAFMPNIDKAHQHFGKLSKTSMSTSVYV